MLSGRFSSNAEKYCHKTNTNTNEICLFYYTVVKTRNIFTKRNHITTGKTTSTGNIDLPTLISCQILILTTKRWQKIQNIKKGNEISKYTGKLIKLYNRYNTVSY